MRTVEYTALWGDTPTKRERLTVADLLRHIPYFLTGGIVPPLEVSNARLREGAFQAGMSGAGRWTPFEVAPAEYEEVVADLVANGAHGKALRVEPVPQWVRTRNEWHVWVSERVYSIPSAPHLEHLKEVERLQAAAEEAAQRGDEDARIACVCRLNDCAMEWSEFMQRHRKPRSE